jgi:hypothetical protein
MPCLNLSVGGVFKDDPGDGFRISGWDSISPAPTGTGDGFGLLTPSRSSDPVSWSALTDIFPAIVPREAPTTIAANKIAHIVFIAVVPPSGACNLPLIPSHPYT